MWLKIVLNVLGAALTGYATTGELGATITIIGSVLTGLFQKRPQDKDKLGSG